MQQSPSEEENKQREGQLCILFPPAPIRELIIEARRSSPKASNTTVKHAQSPALPLNISGVRRLYYTETVSSLRIIFKAFFSLTSENAKLDKKLHENEVLNPRNPLWMLKTVTELLHTD